MIERLPFGNYSGRTVDGVSEFGTAIAEAQKRYDTLIRQLGEFGTEVSRQRTLERDADIFPHRFVRGARHVFIFPPQEVGPETAESGIVPGTEGAYALETDNWIAEYDESLVQGEFLVSYDDSGRSAILQVEDLQEGLSDVPKEVWVAISSAVERLETPQTLR